MEENGKNIERMSSDRFFKQI